MRAISLLVGLSVPLLACGTAVSSFADGGADDGGQPRRMLSGAPDCGSPMDAGTASDLYQSIVLPYGCGAGGCHGGTPPNLFEIPDGPGLRTAMLMKSSQVPELNRVTPGDVHASYLMYKLMGQHMDAGYAGSGARMPLDGPPYLTEAQLCSVVNWINAGAP